MSRVLADPLLRRRALRRCAAHLPVMLGLASLWAITELTWHLGWLVCFATVALVLAPIDLVERFAGDAAPLRVHADEPAERVLLGGLVLASLVVVASTGRADVAIGLAVVAIAIAVKLGLRRWEPSKDPADSR